MVYEIYTDGACAEGYISAAYFIRSRRKVYEKGVAVYKGKSSAVAETVAIGLAVEKLLKCCRVSPDDTVRIITDSKSSIEFLDSALHDSLGGFRGTLDKRAWLAWEVVRDLAAFYHTELHKVNAHGVFINGNVVVDRLAKLGLRQAVLKASDKKEKYEEAI